MTVSIHEYKLTTEHAASSYGMPVLVDPTGTVYGVADEVSVGGQKVPAWGLVENWLMFCLTEDERRAGERFLSQLPK